MFVNRSLDNSEPLAKISPEILQKIETVQTTIGVATSNNTADTIVKRDGAGGFSAGIITTSGLSDGSKLMLQATGTLTRLGVNSGPTMSGINNTAVGLNAMNTNSSGSANCCIGSNAGGGITTGGENTLIGHLAGSAAGVNLSTGTRNTLIETGAVTAAVNQTNSIAIGYAAQAPASNTIQLGNGITNVYTSGVLNAAGLESIGTTLNIASQNNTSTVNIGSGSGVQAINVGNSGTGKTTIALGGGTDEVKVNLPLKNAGGTSILNTINGNCTFGPNSMPNVTDINNTSVGTNSGAANVTGFGNTFIGYDSGKIGNGVGLTLNTAVGHSSLLTITEGRDNTAIGHASLVALTTGSNNTAIGKASGGGVTTGTNNTFIGLLSNTSVGTVVNSTAIGNGASVDASNTIQLGNTSVTSVKTSGTLTAAGLESVGTTLTIAGLNNTSVVDIGSGTGVQTINMGNNGTGATVINLGGAGDTVNISGTLNNVTTTNTQVADKTLVLNSGGTAATAGTAGIYFEEAGSSANSYVRVSSDRSKMELKAPTGSLITLNQSLQTTDTVTFAGATINGNVSSTGNVSTAVTPTAANHLTNKAYVDNKVAAVSNQLLKTTDIVSFAGLNLPTIGGTARTLNYYEEYSFYTNFTGATYTANYGFLFVRIGKLVTMTSTTPISFTASSSGVVSSEVKYPDRFRSFGDIQIPIEISDNTVRVGGIVNVVMGDIGFGCAHYSNFINGRNYYIYPFSISWVLE